ncbi:heme-dependent oxidative N-demethylase family protein [Rhizobium mayense]|uniref:DUF3445 domain-containing protein n=1 Tax=Rhizobium mayense TaxID=1312184 RepID=A0ABT7JSE7_9HYPH|nr:DUF3445 domain-containing protein [Rhizobium mayense]MDL2399271.1 DUF3445 domain-containing protein [Rhizobium mayense]
MTQLTYTPYDGSAKPFAIGLAPLDLARWIEPDADLGRYLHEKARLSRDHLNEVFVAEDNTQDAQQEALDLLAAYLCERHAAVCRRESDIVSAAGHSVDLADPSLPPLLKAGSLIADDLVIMRRKADGWHLVAGHVAFPSSWSLAEKFGRPMQAIHGEVPGFGDGTRNAVLINRIFDNLQVTQPVERFNWSVSANGNLHLPFPPIRPKAGETFTLKERFARIERQTLRKLPISGDILFTIRIYVDPIAAIASHPKASELASSFAAQLDALDDSQAAYKALVHQKAELVRQLRMLAEAASDA